MSTRRTLLGYGAASVALLSGLGTPAGTLAAWAQTPATDADDSAALACVATLLALTPRQVARLSLGQQAMLVQSLLWLLKYDRDTTWLAAQALEDAAHLPAFVALVRDKLQEVADTLHIP